jgi:mono/diheme cytochrome c family protein
MVILEGVHRQPDTPDLLMPAFAGQLSDQQIVTLVKYLTRQYGNPDAQTST